MCSNLKFYFTYFSIQLFIIILYVSPFIYLFFLLPLWPSRLSKDSQRQRKKTPPQFPFVKGKERGVPSIPFAIQI